jgi:hypothetical protein
MMIAGLAHVPLGFLVLAGFAIWLVRRLAQQGAVAASPASGWNRFAPRAAAPVPARSRG